MKTEDAGLGHWEESQELFARLTVTPRRRTQQRGGIRMSGKEREGTDGKSEQQIMNNI